MSSLTLLWDESHLWGLMAWRALAAIGLPFNVVKGVEIAQGALRRKPPSALIVPGGTARRKAERLGPEGLAAIRDYVAAGGTYLGFCGGAGLGLTGPFGLGLCPWSRGGFTNRLLHLVSGHMHVCPARGNSLVPEDIAVCKEEESLRRPGGVTPPSPPDQGGPGGIIPPGRRRLLHEPDQKGPLLPVWWPARFAPQADGGVEILATYQEPGPDFWVADLPLSTLPEGTLAGWEALYGVTLKPSHLTDAPCLISGNYGAGRYILSYAHLETPGSATANRWLTHILEQVTGQAAPRREVPCWHLREQPLVWQDANLARLVELLDEIVALGLSHFLLFERNAWLLGWRAGIPGSNLNHLHALARQAAAMEPTPAAEVWWRERKATFLPLAERFHEGVVGYLLAERLAMTLSHSSPNTVSPRILKEQREALFGPPMAQGGLYVELVGVLEELMYRQVAH